MIWDGGKEDGPGAYGEGLAAPLGEMRWLDDMKGPLTFRRLRMGEHGDLRFPYHLLKHEVGLHFLCESPIARDSAVFMSESVLPSTRYYALLCT